MHPRRRPAVLFVLLLMGALLLSGCLGPAESTPHDEQDDDRKDDGVGGGNGTGGQDDGGTDPGNQTGNGTGGGSGNGTGEQTGNGTGNQTGNETGNETGDTWTWPDAGAATIRPGIRLLVDNFDAPDGYCTANFVFKSRTNDTLYIGMAAHCTDGVGSRIYRPPTHDTAFVEGSTGPQIGVTVYSSWDAIGFVPGDAGVGDDMHPHDFALIRVLDSVADQVHPAVRHYGGPTALGHFDDVSLSQRVIAYGDSPLRPGPQELDRQEGIVRATTSENRDGSPGYSIHTVMSGAVQGDSGSGLLTKDGKAIGVLSAIEFGGSRGTSVVYSSLSHAVDHMNGYGWDVELVTWDQFDDGL